MSKKCMSLIKVSAVVAYARLGALRVRVKGLGVEKYNDGFEMNEAFIKSKVIAMIAVKQEDTNLALNLQIMTKSADLNSDDLPHTTVKRHTTLLSKQEPTMEEEDYELGEDEEMTSTSDIATDFAFFAKKYKAKFPMLLNDKKKRTCYNCDEDNHFANECPYEKRVDKPKFIKGVKPRLKPNPINDRYKKNKGRAFVGAEYLSDEEEEDEEKEAGVAGLAFSKPGSLFTYDYSKDYSTENDVGSSFMARTTQDDDSDDSTSSTIVGSCLMARETKTNAYLESLVTKYGLDYHPNESSCEQASILEENVRLTKELAKFTTAKNKMGLDDLLSKQRSNNQKFGLGYAPKSYKKNNYKKEKPAEDKNKKGYSSGGPKWVFDSGCTNHMTGGRGVLDQFIEDINKKSSITFGDNSKGKVLGACVAGKQLKKKHPIKSIVTTSRPLELLHLDLFGPSHYDTLGGSKYGLVIVDDYSRYSWVFLLKSKDETHREFITFAKKAQRTYESEIKTIRTDNGTEFKNYTMQEFVDDEGIKHEFSAPYTTQQNGVVERKNRTIIEMERTMLSEFNSPHNFWGEAISTAVHYSNRLLRPLHNKTPYELLTGNKPNVMYIRVFGCKCLVKNNKGKLGKFETRTIEGIFVGYAENSHAYRYYNRSTGTIEVSCDVVFLEDNGSQVEQVVPCVAGNNDDPSSAIKHMGIGHIRPMEVHNDDQDDGVEVSSSAQVEPSSTQAEPSSATQEPSSTQDESHSEEQEENPHTTEQDHDDDQETSSTHDQAQVVPHDQVLARDEFIDHEGTIRKIKAATRASDMKVDQVLDGDWSGEDRGTVAKRGRRASQTIGGSSSGGRTKTTAHKRKDKHAAQGDVETLPDFNIGDVHIGAWKRLRETNPYRFEAPTYTGGDKFFWTQTQQMMWDEYYNSREHMKNGCIVMPKAVKDVLAIHEATTYRFVVETLRRMGLYELVCLTPTDGCYCPLLVRQFHCTVFFHDDPARTMTWMTGKEKYTCNYLDFCDALGFGGGRAHGFKLYSQQKFNKGDIAFCYPREPTARPPTISGMFYSYLLLAKLFRESLISKSGDTSECRGYHLNLMYYCNPEHRRRIDGCDLIYSELRRCVRDRMTPNYAQYIQLLINRVVSAPLNTQGERVKMEAFKVPTQGDRPDVPAMMPSERRSKERHDPASSSYTRRPQHGVSRFFSSMWQMCKNTNDVAHQSLAMNQETRRRQNEFMATRNVTVPPPGPELEPVHAPNWEMPPISDQMFQNFDPTWYGLVVLLLCLHVLLLLLMMKRMKRMMMARAHTPLGMSSIDGCASTSPLFLRSDAKGGEESRV
ncbi:hypothetical protein QYE76_047945 [Lolium multiflorum]|uniref:Gag-pol polyprotein n=1 Tax=Lolium multiflorum TaxID=4521 RepID=A0AAD8TSQ0_LOLMU|nr:hypothetical protein QYE76_047945 [Lolium multiflorum]